MVQSNSMALRLRRRAKALTLLVPAVSWCSARGNTKQSCCQRMSRIASLRSTHVNQLAGFRSTQDRGEVGHRPYVRVSYRLIHGLVTIVVCMRVLWISFVSYPQSYPHTE